MKRIAGLVVFCFFSVVMLAQTTVTIGVADGSQEYPFGMHYGYERSASLYLFSDIGYYGLITSLAWNVNQNDLETCPTKIYLKQNVTSISQTTWSSMISGATLVFDGTTSFPAAGWQTIDIADFAYTTGGVLVLCETNYGTTTASSYPDFFYTDMGANRHEFWTGSSAPTGNGNLSYLRPDIKITLTTPNSNPVSPSGFMAAASSSSQINLSWKLNIFSDTVLIAYNSSNTFGTPSGTYHVGDAISGGGTVLYKGKTLSTSQTGLSSATTHYYMAWSVHSVVNYSTGVSSSATTQCSTISSLPYVTDFETSQFPPQCWSLACKAWQRSTAASGYGTGSASAWADFFTSTYSGGKFDLISPVLDLSSYTSPTISFDHAYATYNSMVDKLELYYSTNGGTSYTLLTTYLGGISGALNTGGSSATAFIPTSSQWASKTYALPAGTNRVKFRGISAGGNNLYLDNITFSASCDAPTSPLATPGSVTADLSWTSGSTTWDVKWGDNGFNPASAGTLVSSITQNPYTLTGLTPNHAYAYYVRSYCGGIQSSWAGPCNFTTACAVQSIPYAEDFDGYTPPATGCLTVTNNNGDANQWASSTAFPRSSPNSMFITKNASLAMDDWFFTPGLALSAGTTYLVSFWYRTSASAFEKMEVKWGTSPASSGMTLGQLWNNAGIKTSTYLQGTAVVTPSSASTYYVGWHGYSDLNRQFLSVDDIAVTEVTSVTWNGSVSADWNDPSNWTPAVVPMVNLDVIVPSCSRYPLISGSGMICDSLTIQAGSLTISPGCAVTINGDLTVMSGATLNNQGSVFLKGNLVNQNP